MKNFLYFHTVLYHTVLLLNRFASTGSQGDTDVTEHPFQGYWLLNL